jgi:hypothetical protein
MMSRGLVMPLSVPASWCVPSLTRSRTDEGRDVCSDVSSGACQLGDAVRPYEAGSAARKCTRCRTAIGVATQVQLQLQVIAQATTEPLSERCERRTDGGTNFIGSRCALRICRSCISNGSTPMR